MKTLNGCFMLLLVACSFPSDTQLKRQGVFIPLQAPLPERADVPLVDCILSLPAGYCTELNKDQFALKLNSIASGASPDVLTVPGDGTFPTCEYRLDRRNGNMRRTSFDILDGPKVETFQRVKGGWLRTP